MKGFLILKLDFSDEDVMLFSRDGLIYEQVFLAFAKMSSSSMRWNQRRCCDICVTKSHPL